MFKKIFLEPIYRVLEKRLPGLGILRLSQKERDKEEILRKIMNYVAESRLTGDYLEFGVFRGGTFSAAYRWAQKNKHLREMRFYAFDSFEGLPDIKGKDAEFAQFSKGEYFASLDIFKNNLKAAGVDFGKVEIIPGWFNKTLTADIRSKLPMKSAAVIWVDCDLYESTVPVLEFIKDYIVDGTIIVFDDWFLFRGNSNAGEQLAFREWLKKYSEFSATEFHKYSWHGNSFIINRN